MGPVGVQGYLRGTGPQDWTEVAPRNDGAAVLRRAGCRESRQGRRPMSGSGKFLIVSWDGGGNAPPALNLGARLVRQGHQVRLVGWQSMASRAAAAGLEFATYPSVPPWPPDLAFEDAIEERLLPALAGPGTRDDILAEAKGFAPDVVVVDCMMDAGLQAASELGRPSAVLVHLPYSAFMYEWGDEAERAEKARFLGEAGAVLVLVPPGFDAPCPAPPPNTGYVGPITDPNPRPPLDPRDAGLLAEPGDPWVLLSLSTTLQGQAAALPPLLDAVAALPVRVLLTLGGALPASAVDPPPNVTVRGFVPHQLALPHMAAVISHGGLSTITAALTAGVPLLCIPQGRDQSENAARVVASGVGRALATDAPPAQITRALGELLADPAALREARRFADVIAGLGCGEAATRSVADLARTYPRRRT
jgi:UDP:flavonoid glycosyltransferase YjiC (YdhE family)